MNYVLIFVTVYFIVSKYSLAIDFTINATATVLYDKLYLKIKCFSNVTLEYDVHRLVVNIKLQSRKGRTGLNNTSNVRNFYYENNKKYYKEVSEQFLFVKDDPVFCSIDVIASDSDSGVTFKDRKETKVLIIKEEHTEYLPDSGSPHYVTSSRAPDYNNRPATRRPVYGTSRRAPYYTSTTRLQVTTHRIPNITHIVPRPNVKTRPPHVTTHRSTSLLPNTTEVTTTPFKVYEATTISGDEGSTSTSVAVNNPFKITEETWFKAVVIFVPVVIVIVIVIFCICKVAKKKKIIKIVDPTAASTDTEEIYCRPNVNQQSTTPLSTSPEELYSEPVPKKDRKSQNIQYPAFENRPLYTQVLPKSVRKASTSKSPYANIEHLRTTEPTYAELQKYDNIKENSTNFDGGYAVLQNVEDKKRKNEYSNVFKGYVNNNASSEYVEPCYSEVNKMI